MKAATKSTKREEKIVREVIKNFGAEINLNEKPFVLIEILRKFGLSWCRTTAARLPVASALAAPPRARSVTRN